MNLKMVETALDLRRHQLLQDVAERSAQFAIKHLAVEEDKAIDFGNDLADFLSEHWKGQSIYISADTRYHHTERDLEIFRRMKRGNANEIAKDLGISFVRVHQIHRRLLAELKAHLQPALFNEQDADGDAELSTGQKTGK